MSGSPVPLVKVSRMCILWLCVDQLEALPVTPVLTGWFIDSYSPVWRDMDIEIHTFNHVCLLKKLLST